jgi:hypothetical protein
MVPQRPFFIGRPRLRAVEGLNLAFLIQRQHQRVLGRIDVEPDNIAHLLDEPGIVGELEAFHAVRLEPVLAPDMMDRRRCEATGLRHAAQRPLGGIRRFFVQRAFHHRRHLLGRERRERLTARCVPEQAIGAVVHVAFLPAPDRRLALAARGRDGHRAGAIRRHEHDPRAPDMVLRRLPIGNDRLQPLSIPRPKPNRHAFPHRADSQICSGKGTVSTDQTTRT